MLDTNIVSDMVRNPFGPAAQRARATDDTVCAHAPALGATMVTANVREYARIPGLKLENWMA